MSPVKLFIISAVLIFIVSLTIYLQQTPETKTNDVKPASPMTVTSVEKKAAVEFEETPPKPQKPDLTKKILLDVPFTVQAPLLEWSDPHFQDACEEASVLMAMKWIKNEEFGTKAESRNEILAISLWQTEKFGSYHDTSAEDTAERIFKGYFNYNDVSVRKNISSDDIILELEMGNIVIAPMNGQALKNPFFTQPGPERHMVLIKGYDPESQEFITNDPGVSQGKSYRYPVNVFMEAIRDYPTGDHLPIVSEEKNIIVVRKL